MYTKKLGAGVYLNAEKLIPLLLLVLASFFKGFAISAFDAGASILFLITHVGSSIPFVFMATAVLLALLWPFLSAVKEKTIFMPVWLMFFSSILLSVLFGLSFFVNPENITMAFMVFKDIFKVLAQTAFWMVAFRFGLLHKKPSLLVCVLFAHVVGSLFVSGLLYVNEDISLSLILLAIVSSFLACFTLKALIANNSAPYAKRLSFRKTAKKKKADFQHKKFHNIFYALSGLLFFSIAIFDFYFLRSVIDFSDSMIMITQSYASLFVLESLFISVFLFLFLKGIGTFFSFLYLIPCALVLLAVSGVFPLFSLIISAKAVLDVAQFYAKESTLQSIPFVVSLRTGYNKTLMRKSFFEPLGLFTAGLFLYYAERKMMLSSFLYTIGGLAGVVYVMLYLMRQTYVSFTINLLKNHLWRGGRLLFMGKRMMQQLTLGLNDTNADEVVYALRILEEAISPAFITELKKALHHKNEEVRLYVLSKIEEKNFTFMQEDVRESVQTETNFEVQQAAWRVLCRIGTSEDREEAAALIAHDATQEGALTGLLSVGREGVFVAIERVSALMGSLHPEHRRLAASVLGESGNPAFYQPLYALLYDEEVMVARTALIATSKVLNPNLLPAVMDTFRVPELREEAVNVLLSYKEKAFPEMEKIIRSTDYPVQFRMLLAKVLGRISSPLSEKLLFDLIDIPDRRVRFNIVKSLVLLGCKASMKEASKIRLCLYDELEEVTGIFSALDSIEKEQEKNASLKEPLGVFASSLQGEIEHIKERILLLLALLQPSETIIEYLSNYISSQEEEAVIAKIVDKVLSGELRTLCLPLFESKTTQEKLTLLRPHFYPPVLSTKEHIKEIMNTQTGEVDDWTRICAIYVAGFFKEVSFVNAFVKLLSSADSIIRETTVWAIGETLPREEATRLISSCLTDTNPRVARMARFVTDGTGKIFFKEF